MFVCLLVCVVRKPVCIFVCMYVCVLCTVYCVYCVVVLPISHLRLASFLTVAHVPLLLVCQMILPSVAAEFARVSAFYKWCDCSEVMERNR